MGIVAKVTGFLSENKGFVLESAQHGDATTGNFFMRTVFQSDEKIFHAEAFAEKFGAVAREFSMDYHLYDTSVKPRVMILVSKQGHCLNDLLHRCGTGGALNVDISAVVSNHADLGKMAKWYDLPFHHLPVTAETKSEQEANILQLFKETGSDLMVLARYMQVLSPSLVDRIYGRAINIHHSFLPSFKGAKPYHQAFDRGVKIIGATAHYVSNDLDEGPIIEQEVTRVDHVYTPEKFIELGRDMESLVLARAVQYHVERRVILNNTKTVVFK